MFATQFWPRFSVIGEYTGVMRCPADMEEAGGTNSSSRDGTGEEGAQSEYAAAVFKSAVWSPVIDAAEAGNETRFINDYRRHPQGRPNCCFSQTYLAGRPALVVVVVEDVGEGEELLIDYGDTFWRS